MVGANGDAHIGDSDAGFHAHGYRPCPAVTPTRSVRQNAIGERGWAEFYDCEVAPVLDIEFRFIRGEIY